MLFSLNIFWMSTSYLVSISGFNLSPGAHTFRDCLNTSNLFSSFKDHDSLGVIFFIKLPSLSSFARFSARASSWNYVNLLADNMSRLNKGARTSISLEFSLSI